MNIKNNTISTRQCFRICLLENIAIPMIVVPFVTVRIAGAYHILAFVLGLVLFVMYAAVMYRYAKRMPEGMIPIISQRTNFVRIGLAILYIIRYALRCAIILLYFSRVAHNYMLRSVPVVMLAIPFVFICGYGALRDIEKRGRLLELLFWWMITPLIFIGVFVISNTNWKLIGNELFDFTTLQEGVTHPKMILFAAYLMLIVTSSTELMMYTIVTQKKQEVDNVKKIITWISIAFVFSYTFVFGILGRAWVGSDSMAALNVMEAAAVPFGLMQRMDYAVLAFWIIGVFAMLSGYLFYANQYGMQCILKQNHNIATMLSNKEFDTKRKIKENLMMLGITLLVLLFMLGWQWNVTRNIFAGYLVYVDLWISLIVPYIMTHLRKSEKKEQEQMKQRKNGVLYSHGAKTFVILGALCTFGAALTGCGKRYESASIENRDYVERMRVEASEATRVASKTDAAETIMFLFVIADLEEYSSSGSGKLEFDWYSCEADSLEDAIARYYDDMGQQLDLGHMEEIFFDDSVAEDLEAAIIEEFSDMPFVPKSINVYEGDSDDPEILREKIKALFSLKQI